LDEHQLIITRAELDGLRDRLYVLQCAVQDVDRDFSNGFKSASAAELGDALHWLIEAARPLQEDSSL
jgi:hypothetical protein